MTITELDPPLASRGEPSDARPSDDDGRGLHEQQLLGIVDALPTLVAYVGADQRYRFVNASYERWFGRSAAEIVGKHLEEVLGGEAYRAILPHAERALAGEPVTYESEVRYRLGGPRSIEATYIPQRADDGSVAGFVSLVADVSERRSFERFRSSTEERAQRLLRITAALAEAVTPEEVFAAAVDHVAAAVGASSVGLWIVDEAGTTMRLARSLGYAKAAREHLAVVSLDAPGRMPAVDAILRGEPIWIASQPELFERYPHLRAVASPSRSYRITCLPLVACGRKLGVLALTIEEARDISDDERSFSMLVARYTSQALERLRLLEAERHSHNEALAAAARMEILGRASRALVEATLDTQATLEGIASAVGHGLRSSVTVHLLEPDGRITTPTLHYPDPEIRGQLQELLAIAPLHIGEGVTGGVIATGRSVLVPAIDPAAVAERAAPPFRAFAERHPVYAFMCAPLRTRGRIIGAISTLRHRPGEPYVPEDLHLLEELADRAAAAIENSRLHQEVVDARTRAEQLLTEQQETVRYNETFAGILAHDLRNPLGAMMTAAQLLLRRQEGEGDKVIKPLSRIVSSGERMARMIEQLLDFTRARVGGGIEVQPQDSDLADLCGHVMDELELVHPEWKLRREVWGDTRGAWDPDRLLQVISNLVTNAGFHGKPDAGVRVRVDGTSPEQVSLEIHNEGAIPDKLLPSIFDPFRGTQHRRDMGRGLGLGLFITKQIVQAHGGVIELCSTEIEGTTFVVRLPRRAAPSRKPTPPPVP
jgi:PAS domain S-box-containing protein